MTAAGPGFSARFRPEIAGLRGFAILVVVFFHAGVQQVSGGFLGVDIFFVISGFVITRTLLAELTTSSTVNLAAFYGRRARRLIPMATLTIVATVAFGAFLLPSTHVDALLQAGFFSSIFVGNLYFAAHAFDYFGGGSVGNPLLHMWSLGVGEQFYLFWPGAMLLIARSNLARLRSALVIAVGGVLLLSLAFVVLVGASASSLSYYTLLGRGFEPAFGALLALTIDEIEIRLSVSARGLLSVIGATTLILCVLVIPSGSSWPNVVTILPIIATGLVIVGGTHGAGWLASSAAFQGLGGISFGLYLIHWPLLVLTPLIFGRALSLTETTLLMIGAVATAAYLAREFENPLRYSTFKEIADRALAIFRFKRSKERRPSEVRKIVAK